METYLVPMWVVECGVQRDGCISMVKAADAQATVEALQAQLKTARYDAVRAFVRGEDKMCFVCGAKEPCELKDDPSSPCTFDPTPMELKQQVEALQRVRDEFERERDQLHAALMEAKAALDAERKKVAERNEFIADCDMTLDRIQAPRTNDGQEELVSTWRRIELIGGLLQQYRVQLEEYVRTQSQLSQLQALVREFFTSEDKWAVAYRELERLGYTLDATTPATTKT